MARITIEDCLKKVPSRFLLVNMVARRVRQIREGSEYLVSSPKNEDIVVSLREIAAGKLTATLKKGKRERQELLADAAPAVAPSEPEQSTEDIENPGADETAAGPDGAETAGEGGEGAIEASAEEAPEAAEKEASA